MEMPIEDRTTKKITVEGLVQGIGYRPFVAELAERCAVGGWVRNTNGILTVLASGQTEDVQRFLQELRSHGPDGARIGRLVCEEMSVQEFASFQIIESESCGDVRGIPWIPTDLPTCDHCLHELRDPKNRRYRHPFISCTSCGPRYSIIETIPYDRENSSMKKFPMCGQCGFEYQKKGNRRRHAQTIACPDCGPELAFSAEGFCENCVGDDAVKGAVQLLQAGGIAAVKDIGGYHLACTPFSDTVVQQLRKLKGREKKPFAVMFPDMASIEEYCEVSGEEEALLRSVPRPIVLLKKKKIGKRLAESVCGGSPDIGAMLPCNPLQTLLTDELGPLVMTSANVSGELLIFENAKMAEWLKRRQEECEQVLLGFLHHDRPIVTPLDDSVVRVVCGRTQIIRRARGFVPEPIPIPVQKNIFAAGGDLKACFCYTGEGKAYLSQHFGDLEDESCRCFYQKETERMKCLFHFEPEFTVCDMHPGYLSARELDNAVKIQHHEAHVASVIAEHGLKGPVLGFAFDGTGYGRDRTIWGSEAFLWDGTAMERIAHLKPVRLIGGDEGAKNADTILYGYVASFGKQTCDQFAEMSNYLPRFNFERGKLVEKAISCGVHTVASSSMGRLFDAVSAFLDICHYNEYEGEAAIELEQLAATAEEEYTLTLALIPDKAVSVRSDREERGCVMGYLADAEPLFIGMMEALRKEIPKAAIARGFISAVSAFICDVCEKMSDCIAIGDVPLRQVALSGGTFQNRILLEKTVGFLEEKGYQVFINEKVPPSDGGICLGQAYLCGIDRKENR